MRHLQGRMRGEVRTVFVSDVHLGCRHSQAELLLDFLEAHIPGRLYLVGDFIDGWKLRRRWFWQPVYSRILRRLLELDRLGTKICYTPGNHDEFLRNFLLDLGFIRVNDTFVHEAPAGERLLVIHGDQFDAVERRAPWLSVVSSYLYDVLLSANRLLNRIRRKPRQPYALCGAIKTRVKGLVNFFSEFEANLVDAARNKGCDGVVCGHIHSPKISQHDGFIYCNTGDWVEHCTALIEYEDGAMEIIYADGTPGDWTPPTVNPLEVNRFELSGPRIDRELVSS